MQENHSYSNDFDKSIVLTRYWRLEYSIVIEFSYIFSYIIQIQAGFIVFVEPFGRANPFSLAWRPVSPDYTWLWAAYAVLSAVVP